MKRLYALILTIAIVFSISVAPAHAASAALVTETAIQALVGLAVTTSANNLSALVQNYFTSSVERAQAINQLNDTWRNCTPAEIVRYACILSPDDLYYLAYQANSMGFPCSIVSLNASSYGGSGTLWYIRGTGMCRDKWGDQVAGPLVQGGFSFSTQLYNKNMGTGLTTLNKQNQQTVPAIFCCQFELEEKYLSSQLSVMNSILSALGTTNTLLANINNGIANLSGVGGGGGSAAPYPFGNRYFCIDGNSKDVVYFADKGVFPSLTALSEFVMVLSSQYQPLYMLHGDAPYIYADTWYPYEISIKKYSDEVGYAIWCNSGYAGGWLHCAYNTMTYDSSAFALIHCPLDHAESDLLGQLLVKTIDIAADVHDIATRVEEISDPLLTYIDTNFADPLENVRPNVIISFQLFNNVFGDVSDDDHSLSDILEYFDDWGER